MNMIQRIDMNKISVWPVFAWAALGLTCAVLGFYGLYPILMDKPSPLPVWLQVIGAIGYLPLMVQAGFRLNKLTN